MPPCPPPRKSLLDLQLRNNKAVTGYADNYLLVVMWCSIKHKSKTRFLSVIHTMSGFTYTHIVAVLNVVCVQNKL